MAEVLTKHRGKFFLLAILTSLALVDLFILLDIRVLRQCAGFAFYTVAPGLILLYLFNLDRLGRVEKVMLVAGLSIAVLTAFGLLINWALPQMGYARPLATIPVVVSFSIVLVVLAILAYFKKREDFFPSTADFDLNGREKLWLLVPMLLPLMGIVGTRLINAQDNNSLLMVTLALIAAYVVVVALRQSGVSERIYPVAILFISGSLMIMRLLRSPHVIGADVHAEYYLFRLTLEVGQWQIHPNELFDADVVISLLPAIYQLFLKLDPEYLYDLIPRFLFALSPLAIYSISRRYVGSFYAFFAAFFFVSQLTFLDDSEDFRNRIAVFFFALVIMVLVHENLSERNRRLLFIIFSAMCVLSNYSTTYVFLIILVLSYIGVKTYPFVKRALVRLNILTMPTNPDRDYHSLGSGGVSHSPTAETPIRIGMVMLLCLFVYIWYGQVTGTAFNLGVSFIATTFRSLGRFSELQSRSGLVSAALGGTLREREIPQYLELVFSWLTVVFVAIGVLTVVAQRLFPVKFSNRRGRIRELASRFDSNFLIMSLTCCLVLVLTAILPWVSVGYDLMRAHFQAMVVLSPFFVIGGIAVATFLRTRPIYWLGLAVLIPYFWLTSGFLYEAFGKPHVLTLSSQSLPYDLGYVHDQDSYAAKWLKQYREPGLTVYSFGRGNVLMSQAGFSRDESGLELYRVLRAGREVDGYIYLTYTSVARGKVALPGYRVVDGTPYLQRFAQGDVIYASNGAMIYRHR